MAHQLRQPWLPGIAYIISESVSGTRCSCPSALRWHLCSSDVFALGCKYFVVLQVRGAARGAGLAFPYCWSASACQGADARAVLLGMASLT